MRSMFSPVCCHRNKPSSLGARGVRACTCGLKSETWGLIPTRVKKEANLGCATEIQPNSCTQANVNARFWRHVRRSLVENSCLVHFGRQQRKKESAPKVVSTTESSENNGGSQGSPACRQGMVYHFKFRKVDEHRCHVVQGT